MNNDLISRQAAINIIRQKIGYIDDGRSFETELSDVLMSACKNFIKDIENLSSVQPPKTGQWKSLFGTAGKVFECSECGAAVTVAYECFKDGCYYDYCPYCGAKMEGEVK